MPLERDFSIVADSTEPSSPRLEMERAASSEPVKRAARTYGKPREWPADTNAFDPSDLILRPSSRDVVHRTAPPGLSEHVPSTSSPSRTNNSALDEDEPSTTSPPKFSWAWKEKLQAMDDEEDEEATAVPTEAATEHTTSLFGKSSLLPDKPAARAPLKTGDALITAPSTSQMDDADDVFADSSLSSKSPSNGPNALAEQTFSLSSPPVAPRKHARRSVVYTGSDSGNDAPKPSSSTSSSSSQPLHSINTPKSKSSHTTPPTSEDEMALNNAGKGRLAGKKKAQPTRNVTPLNLVAEPVSEPGSRPALTTKRGKVKAPTKKDREEMVKERIRLVAESNAAVLKDTAQKFTKTRFLELVQERSRASSVINAKKVEIPLSDPIETYSSPLAAPATKAVDPRDARSPGLDSDNEELPEVSDIFAERLAQQKKADLLEKKKRALQMQKRQAVPLPESDDDAALEIVLPNPRTGVHEEEERRRSPKKKHISEARKQQLRLAQIGTSKMKAVKTPVSLDVRSVPVASGYNLLRDGKRLDQQALNRLMVSQARQEARKVTSLKEEEWKKHGGRLTEHPEAQAEGLAAAFQTIAAKAATAQQEAGLEQEDDGTDASDEDWAPEMRGSASPEPEDDVSQDEEEADQEAEGENDENAALDYDTTMVEENDDEVLAEPKGRTSRRMVVASDSEEDENNENAPQRDGSPSNRAPYRRATSSAELTEGEQDKENNAFDLGENKENFGSSRTLSAFDFPPSPTQSSSATIRDARRSQWADALRTTQQRKPFQDLLPDDGLASPSQPSFTAKLLQSSQTPIATPGSALKPFIGGGLRSEKSFGSFSQLFNGEGDTFGSAPLLQPAFGGLFESKSQGSGFFDDQEDSQNKPKAPLRRSDTLGLTQEVHAAAKLQPGFQAADNLMRKADSIFEKEQAFLLEAAVKKPASKPELYVNDHGFLTQTRPAEGTPDVYRPSLSPSQRPPSVSPTQPRIRAPLRTLSYTKTLQPESPETAPLRRLRKNATPPPGGSRLEFGSASPPRQRNAFELLVQGAARNRDEKKQKLTKEEIAAFLENEAAESDEDDNFGFGKIKKGDDEEDGEDLDQTLDVLMDDNAMDEDTAAADLVMEKYKEQEEEHDQDLEKLHMAAIQGELRRKRTRGVGVDDSDDDSEDDGNARARRAMKKLRTSDRGDIKHLEANEATRSFAQTYNQSLKDDDDEFAYLNKETQLDEVLATASHPEGGDDADEYEDDEEEEALPQTISTHEVRRQLREVAEEGQDLDEFAMNPEDVSWIEKDEDEPMARVKTVNSRQRPKGQLRNHDDGELSGLLDKPAGGASASSKQWFNQEFKSRNAGTSRSVGGSAITGHTKAKLKASGKTALKAHTSDSASVGKKGVRAEKSMLSAITDKSRHFA